MIVFSANLLLESSINKHVCQWPFGGEVIGAGIGVTAVTLLFSNNFMLAFRGAKNYPKILVRVVVLCSGKLTTTKATD